MKKSIVTTGLICFLFLLISKPMSASREYSTMENVNEAPVIEQAESLCGTTVEIDVDLGTCEGTFTWSTPTAYDNDGDLELFDVENASNVSFLNLLSDTGIDGGTFPLGGSTLVKYRARDVAGNITRCEIKVKVREDIDPTIDQVEDLCDSTVVLNALPGSCEQTYTWTTPNATDNCGLEIFDVLNADGLSFLSLLSDTGTDGGAFPIGTTTIDYRARDNFSNAVICRVKIRVNDDIDPTIIQAESLCGTTTIINADPGVCESTFTWTTPTASDNCPIDVFAIENAADVSFLSLLSDTGTDGGVFPVGLTAIEYEAKDESNNSTSCIIRVRVEDPVAPVINQVEGLCGTTVEVVTSPSDGNCNEGTFYWTTPTASDDCSLSAFEIQNAGDVSFLSLLSETGTDGGVFPLGTTIIRYRARDKSNSTFCNITVQVKDVVDPIINQLEGLCGTITEFDVTPGSCESNFSWTTPTASDECSLQVFEVLNPDDVSFLDLLSGTGTDGGMFPTGLTTINYRATDASNNTTTCQIQVKVNDIAPVITQAEGLCGTTTEIDATPGSCEVNFTWSTPFADDCNLVEFNVTNADDVSFLDLLSNTGTDGGTFPTGLTIIDYQATDASNNITTCQIMVQINDLVDPAITQSDGLCGAPAVQLDADPGSCQSTYYWTTPVASDDCSLEVFDIINSDDVSFLNLLSDSGMDGGSFPIGLTVINYRAKDKSDNTVLCKIGIRVNDIVDPVVNQAESLCGTTVQIGTDPGSCDEGTYYFSTPTASDECNLEVFDVINANGLSFLSLLSDTGTDGGVFPLGLTTINYRARDNSNNATICQISVRVKDLVDPVVNQAEGLCNTTVEINTDPGSCEGTYYWSTPVATDDCNVESFNIQNPDDVSFLDLLSDTGTDGGIFPLGTTIILYNAKDGGPNSTLCRIIVKVKDTAAPIIDQSENLCNTIVNIDADPGMCEVYYSWTTPTASDNCSLYEFSSGVLGDPFHDLNLLSDTGIDDGYFSVGTTIVRYTALDDDLNVNRCEIRVEVADTENPIILCESTIIYFDTYGNAILEVDDIDNGSYDNCGIVSMQFYDQNGNLIDGIYDCNDLGTHTVTLKGVDEAGNEGSCTTQVTVVREGPLSDEWSTTDIGQVTVGNVYQYDACNNPPLYLITGSGNNTMVTTTDNVAFASQSLCGDGSITAKIENVSPNGYGGLMIREHTGAGSKQVAVFSNMSNNLRYEARIIENGMKEVNNFFKPSPVWLKLERQGAWIFAYYSIDGNNFQYVHGTYVFMQNCVEIGLASFTYMPNDQTETAFSNVSISGSNGAFGGNNEYTETPSTVNRPSSSINRRTLAIHTFPNPNQGQFSVQFDQALEQGGQLSLYNTYGQEVKTVEVATGTTQLEWPLGQYASGTYFLILKMGDFTSTMKTIVIDNQ